MQIVIKIDLDNAAFQDDACEELSRLFASIVERVPEPIRETDGAYNLHDCNGNHCGTFAIAPGEQD